jgi:hypothetical protein
MAGSTPITRPIEGATLTSVRGYRIVRVWNNDVLGNLDGVLRMLEAEVKVAPHPDPLPASGERERG